MTADFDVSLGLIRILSPGSGDNRKTVGTGWLINKEERLFITAEHVIVKAEGRGSKKTKSVAVEFYAERWNSDQREEPKTSHHRLTILNDLRDKEADVCFLKYKGELPEGMQAFPLGDTNLSAGDVIRVSGFPGAGLRQTETTGTPLVVETDGYETIGLEPKNIGPGYSGGPAVNFRTGDIIGFCRWIEKDQRGEKTGAFLTTSNTIKRVNTELKTGKAFSVSEERIKKLFPTVKSDLIEYAEKVVKGLGEHMVYEDKTEQFGGTIEERIDLNFDSYFPIVGIDVDTQVKRDDNEGVTTDTLSDPATNNFDLDRDNYGDEGANEEVYEDDDYHASEEEAENQDENNQEEAKDSIGETGPVTDLIRLHDQVFLRAVAGSGKTTSLKRVLIENCRAFLAEESGALITIYVKAKEYDEQHRFKQLILEKVVGDDNAGSKYYFDALLRYPGVQICIDGLNEISSEHYENAIKEISKIVNSTPSTRFVFTSRPAVFGGDLFLTSLLPETRKRMRVFDIRPLGPADYTDYLERFLWKQSGGKPQKENTELSIKTRKKAVSLVNQIMLNDAARKLVSIPLYLDMMGSLTKKSLKKAKSKASLFDEFTQGILQKWKQSRVLSRDFARKCLEKIGYEQINGNYPNLSTIQSWISSIGQNDYDKVSSFIKTAISLGLLKRNISSRRNATSGNIDNSRFDFAHDDFRDYFAAKYIYQEFCQGLQSPSKEFQLPSRVVLNDEQWFQPLLLTADIASNDEEIGDTVWDHLYRELCNVTQPDEAENKETSSLELHKVSVKSPIPNWFSYSSPPAKSKGDKPPVFFMVKGDAEMPSFRIAPLTAAVVRQRIDLHGDKGLKEKEIQRLQLLLKFWSSFYFATGREIIPVEDVFSALATLNLNELHDEILTNPDYISIWANSTAGTTPFREKLLVKERLFISSQKSKKRSSSSVPAKTKTEIARKKKNHNKDLYDDRVLRNTLLEKYDSSFEKTEDISQRALAAFATNLEAPWELYYYIAKGNLEPKENSRPREKDFPNIWEYDLNEVISHRPLKNGILPKLDTDFSIIQENQLTKEEQAVRNSKAAKEVKDASLSFQTERFLLRRALLEATAKKKPEELVTIFEDYIDFDALLLASINDDQYFCETLSNLDHYLSKRKKVRSWNYNRLADNAAKEAKRKQTEEDGVNHETLFVARALIKRHPRIYAASDVIDEIKTVDDLVLLYREASRNIEADYFSRVQAARTQTVGKGLKASASTWYNLMEEKRDDQLALKYLLSQYLIAKGYSDNSVANQNNALIDLIEDGIQLVKARPEVVLKLALAYQKAKATGPLIEVLEEYLEGRKPDKSNIVLWELLANTYFEVGELQLAEKNALQVLELTDDNLDMYLMLGNIRKKFDDFTGAEHFLLLGAEKHPKNAIVLNSLAYTYYQAGNYQEASKYYELKLSEEPENPRARLFFALCCQQLGANELAELNFHAAYDAAEAADYNENELKPFLTDLIAFHLENSTLTSDKEQEEEENEVDAYAIKMGNSRRLSFNQRYLLTNYWIARNNAGETVRLWEKSIAKPTFNKEFTERLLGYINEKVDSSSTNFAVTQLLDLFIRHFPGITEARKALIIAYMSLELPTAEFQARVSLLELWIKFGKTSEIEATFLGIVGFYQRQKDYQGLIEFLWNRFPKAERKAAKRFLLRLIADAAINGQMYEQAIDVLKSSLAFKSNKDRIATLDEIKEIAHATNNFKLAFKTIHDKLEYQKTNIGKSKVYQEAAKLAKQYDEYNLAYKATLERKKLNRSPKEEKYINSELKQLQLKLGKGPSKKRKAKLSNKKKSKSSKGKKPLIVPPSDPLKKLFSMKINTAILYDLSTMIPAWEGEEGSFSVAKIKREITTYTKVGLISHQKAYYYSGTLSDTILNTLMDSSIELQQVSGSDGQNGINITMAMGLDLVEMMYAMPHVTVFAITSSNPRFSGLKRRVAAQGKFLINAFYSHADNAAIKNISHHFIPLMDGGKGKVKANPAPAPQKKTTEDVVEKILNDQASKIADNATFEERFMAMKGFIKALAESSVKDTIVKNGEISGHILRNHLITLDGGDLNYNDYRAARFLDLARMVCTGTSIAIFQHEGQADICLGLRDLSTTLGTAKDELDQPELHSEEYYLKVIAAGTPSIKLPAKEILPKIGQEICNLMPEDMTIPDIIETVSEKLGARAELNDVKQLVYAFKNIDFLVMQKEHEEPKNNTFSLKPEYLKYALWLDHLQIECKKKLEQSIDAPDPLIIKSLFR